MERHLPPDLHDLKPRGRRPGKVAAPYALLAPGGLWLILLFVVPMLAMASLALQEGSALEGYRLTWHIANFSETVSKNGDFLLRSLRNGAIVTGVALILAYPIAYWIAFYGGRLKSLFLFLLLLPFFVSFVIRTVSWSFILSDDGIVFGTLKDIGLLGEDFRVIGTTFAVIAGITYNLLPFTILPLYVSLERIDPSLVEAAKDLYASKAAAFRKVVLPLSMPGIFAAILLTSIPATGDYINAEVLGGPGTAMIGNIIQVEFLQARDYPEAAALAFILMAIMLVGAIVYARILGTAMIGNIIQVEFLQARDYPEAAALAFILMAIMLVGAIVYARILGTEEITT